MHAAGPLSASGRPAPGGGFGTHLRPDGLQEFYHCGWVAKFELNHLHGKLLRMVACNAMHTDHVPWDHRS